MLNRELIVLFKAQSRYGVLRYFIDNLAESFRILGYDTKVIDFCDNNCIKEIEELINNNNIKFFFTFNSIGDRVIKQMERFFSDIPFVSFYVDHPIYHYESLERYIKRKRVIVVDKSYISFLDKVLQVKADFIPHGAYTMVDYNESKKKAKDIIFAGSIQNPDSVRKKWLDMSPSVIGQIFDQILEYGLSKDFFELKKDVDYILGYLQIDIELSQRKEIYKQACLIDQYIRSYRRINVINQLSDFKIDVYGEGWEEFIDNKNHTVHGAVNFNELISSINSSKVLLNILPVLKDGGHERIFTAMYYGAAVATNINNYLNQQFTDDKDIIFYNFNKIDKLSSKLEIILNNENRLDNLIGNGRKKVINNHLWVNRAKEILKSI